MEFQKNAIPCLCPVKAETKLQEQTQELHLPDGLPDVGRVLGAWGQPVIRGKQWQTDELGVSCGVTVWVLYAPEDGSPAERLEAWLPMTLTWELSETVPDGTLLCSPQLRSVDARILSGRKLMIRATVSMTALALTQSETATYEPEDIPEDVQLYRREYPVCLAAEAAEKPFLLDEEVSVPDSVPAPEQLLYATILPQITDRRVMGDKVVFRGNGALHILYRTAEGALASWDCELPFSQYAELTRSYDHSAQAQVLPVVTALETQLLEGGRLRLKAGISGQYVICESRQLSVVEDAYSPFRSVSAQKTTVQIPQVCPLPEETAQVEQTLPLGGNRGVEATILTDQPRPCLKPEHTGLALSGQFQYLLYDRQGQLQSGVAAWQQELSGELAQAQLIWCRATGKCRIAPGAASTLLSAEVQLHAAQLQMDQLDAVTGLTVAEQPHQDPCRPSLIIEKAGNRGLWQLAKENGSTVHAIEELNSLQAAPEPDQLLIIPVL